MASLQLTFSDIYKRVSDYLGLGMSPTGTSLTKVKDLVYRGYRRFLMPLDEYGDLHIWRFLEQERKLVTKSGQAEYALPDDFTCFVDDPPLDAGTNYVSPIERSSKQLRELRNSSDVGGYPEFYALITDKYRLDVEQAFKVLFWPKPDGAYTYLYSYIIEPPKPTEDGHFFIGSAKDSEVVLQCALAAAELQENEMIGPQSAEAKRMLLELIRIDQGRAPNSVGIMLDPSIIPVDYGIRRDEHARLNDATFTI